MTDYKRDPRKAISGTLHLTMEERGAYFGLLDLIYERGSAFPDDDDKIGAQLNVRASLWKRLRKQLLDKGRIRSVDGYLTDDEAEKQLAVQDRLSVTRALAGSGGGLARAAKSHQTRLKSTKLDLSATKVEFGPKTGPEIPDDSSVWVKHLPLIKEKRREEKENPLPSPPPTVDADGVDVVLKAANLIFASLPKEVRGRFRGGPAVIGRCLRTIVERGERLEAITGAAAAYYAHPATLAEGCRYAVNPDRFLVNGEPGEERWRDWVGADAPLPVQAAVDELRDPSAPEETVLWAGRQYAVPRGRPTAEVQAMVTWAQEWLAKPDGWKARDRGPKPGQPGCRLWPSVAEAFEIEMAKVA